MAVIEIPCNLGDTIYEVMRLGGDDPYIISSVVCAIHITDGSRGRCQHKRESYLVAASEVTNWTKHYNINKIGKTIFLTREEAVKAIKRRNFVEVHDNE